ncbi:hypothetical protein VTJ83DRAFT_5576 [Remersonia thermophila]|uniref:Uncharacterized protein n=1 Tax=Remersonia thermophila TaxID=72144 RepID=A0ABR4D866_9PEZI
MDHQHQRTTSFGKTPSVRRKLRKAAPSDKPDGILSTMPNEPRPSPSRRPSLFRTLSAKSCPPTPKGTRAMWLGKGDQEQDESHAEIPPIPTVPKPDTYVSPEAQALPSRPKLPPQEPASYDSEPPSTTGAIRLRRTRPKTPVYEIGQLENRSVSGGSSGSGSGSAQCRSTNDSHRSERERASSVDLIADQYQAVADSRSAVEPAGSPEGQKKSRSLHKPADEECADYLNRPLPPTPPPSVSSRHGHGPDHASPSQSPRHEANQDRHRCLHPHRHSGQQADNHHASHPPPTSDPHNSVASVAGTLGGRGGHVPTLRIVTGGLDDDDNGEPFARPAAASAPASAVSDGAFYFKPVSFESGPGPVLLQESPPPSAPMRQFHPLPQRVFRARSATVGAEAAPRNRAPPPRHPLVPPAPAPPPPPPPAAAAAAAATAAVPAPGTPDAPREDIFGPSRSLPGEQGVSDTPENVSLQICLDLLTRELSAAMRRDDHQRQRQGWQRRLLGHRRGLGPADVSSSSTTTSASSLSFSSAQSRPASPSLSSATSASASTGTSALQVWLMIEAYERVRDEMVRLRSHMATSAGSAGGRGEQTKRVADAEAMLDTWLRALYRIHEEMVLAGGQHQHCEGERGEGEDMGVGAGDWERGNFF